ncbi:MAG: SdrD B-like domain-containing protein, partial [Dehalococcoidia bacterium]|nr:SdrD B-like domain-containing protein [Dehalococcoidia bacterium]
IPAGQSSFTLEVFDGDLGGHWDVHDPAKTGVVKVNYTLYADPQKDGQGAMIVATKTDSDFADDAWGTMYSGPLQASARAPSGSYFYRLYVAFADQAQAANEVDGFKLRVDGQISVMPWGTFGFSGAPINIDITTGKADPGLGTPRNQYNGDWHWFAYVPRSGNAVTFTDTDADYRLSPTHPGNPPDDCSPGPLCFAIPPDIRYTVSDATGNALITNNSPSGDQETETRTVGSAEAGFLDWHWIGVDGHNLVFISSSNEIYSSNEPPLSVGGPQPTVTPAPPPQSGGIAKPSSSSSVRGNVFLDSNCNGALDVGEPPVGGAVITISSDGWSAQTSSQANGRFDFGGLSKGEFKLRLSAPPGYEATTQILLEGITVGGEVQTIVDGKNFGIAPTDACAAPSQPLVTPGQLAPTPAHAAPKQSGPAYGEASREWYLAEGCTCNPFDTRILIANPNETTASVSVTFMQEDGTTTVLNYGVEGRSRLNLLANGVLPKVAFSTLIESDLPVFVERSTYSDNHGQNTIGVNEPSNVWYMAEGFTGPGRDTWLLLMNPNKAPAKVSVTLVTEDGTKVLRTYDLLPTSRLSIYANYLVLGAFAGKIESDLPIVVERSMYLNDMGGQSANATIRPARNWYIPEANTVGESSTWLLMLNPNSTPAIATAIFLEDSGKVVTSTIALEPWTRKTILANSLLPNAAFSVQVRADQEIVVEESIYPVRDLPGYSSPASPSTSSSWYVAEGNTAGPFQEYILVMNPNAEPANVKVNFALDESSNAVQEYPLPSGSRVRINVNEAFPDQNVSAVIEANKPVVAERLMLFRKGGNDLEYQGAQLERAV